MADPVVYDSQLSVFKITDTGSSERDITDYLVNVVPHFSRKKNDITTFNHSHEQLSPGIAITSIDLELVYSEDANVGTDTVLGPLLADSTPRAWKYYPRGTGGKYYSGSGFILSYQPVSKVGDIVRATATLESNSRSRT
ncbi:MAG: hypothetical protein Q8M94_12185 [Ignavibacteria bacterium]|nr:hypothetical protein [Ignavibacteria bacterium]